MTPIIIPGIIDNKPTKSAFFAYSFLSFCVSKSSYGLGEPKLLNFPFRYKNENTIVAGIIDALFLFH